MNKLAVAVCVLIAAGVVAGGSLMVIRNNANARATIKAGVVRHDGGSDVGVLYIAPKIGFRYTCEFESAPRDQAFANLVAHYPRAGGAPSYSLDWVIDYLRLSGEYFDRATLHNGESLKVTPLMSHVSLCDPGAGCISQEMVTVSLTAKQIAAAQKSGLKMQFKASDGVLRVVTIPTTYVQGFMEALPPSIPARSIGAATTPASATTASMLTHGR